MDWKGENANVIKLLFKHEIALSHLYGEYAKRFPDHEDFWSRLSAEEREHAILISKLFETIKDGSAKIDGQILKVNALQTANRRVNHLLSEVKEKDIPFINALSTALDIERSMIEKKAFRVFNGDSPEFQQIMLILEEDTEDHLARILMLYMEHRKQTSKTKSPPSAKKQPPDAKEPPPSPTT